MVVAVSVPMAKALTGLVTIYIACLSARVCVYKLLSPAIHRGICLLD